MNKRNNEVLIALKLTTLQNIVAIGCFTALAGMFEKWWIILFTALFWSRVKISNDESEEECKKK